MPIKYVKKIICAAIAVMIMVPAVVNATDAVAIPTVSDQIFISVGDEAPTKVLHHRGKLLEPVPPNSTIYFKIDGAKRAHDLSGLRPLIRWDEEPTVNITPTIEYKKVFSSDGKTSLGFTYLAAIKLGASYMVADSYTLYGDLMIGSRILSSLKSQRFIINVKGDTENSPPLSLNYDPSSPIFYPVSNKNNISMVFLDKAYFEFDPENQWEVNFSFVTAENEIISAMYPKAKLEFLGWSHQPIFNRRAKLYIKSSKEKFLYRQTPNGLELLDPLFLEEEGAFMLDTRVLGSYVISDVILKNPKEVAVKNNPPTGAML